MGKLVDFLSGTKILEEVISPINGKITVIQSLAFGTYIQVGGLTQSGGVVYDVWHTTLKKVRGQRLEVRKCLILGLAGGSTAKLVRKFWGEEVEITGVDLDPVMVKMGKKYLGLDEYKVKVNIVDAYDYVNKSQFQIPNFKFDLILVDLYIGDEFPEKFESENYIRLVRTVLASDGIVVFNRLYYGEKRKEAMKFGKILEKIFEKVDIVFPEANVMFICYK